MNDHNAGKRLPLIALIASMGGLLFGFDIAVISGVLPVVQQQFSLSAAEQGWFVTSALIGSIIGVAVSGELSDRFGRKKMLFVAAVFFFLSAVGCTLAPGISSIIIFRIIGGIGIGVASIVVPLYLSEIAPTKIRGRLVTCYQLAITAGILSAYLSNAALLGYAQHASLQHMPQWWNILFGKEAWRGMFSMLCIPSIIFLAGLTMVPESGRWLMVKQGSDAHDKGSYKDLLKPNMRKALLLGLSLPFLSQFSGINAIIYYGPTILQQAGIPVKDSLMSQVFFGVAIVLFTLIAIWKVDGMGRRKLYLFGTMSAAISLALTGYCFYTGNTSWLLLLCVLMFLASFAMSIGPLKFVIASEIFPNAIRGRAMSTSIMMMWIADAIVGQLTPISLASLGTAATFWIFSVFCVAGFWIVYMFLPETSGRSLEQIEASWKTVH